MPTRPAVPWLVALALVAVQAAMVRYRPIDGDEGLYLTVFDEVAAGRTLYEDFFYPQFPGLPYVYYAWVRWVSGPSPEGVRGLSLLFNASTLLLVAAWGRALRLSTAVTTALVVLVGASGLTIGWASTIKTYPFCILMSVVAFVALSVSRERGHRALFWPALAGASLGAAGCTRFFYLALLPVSLGWLLLSARRTGDWRVHLRAGVALAAGAALPIAPTAWFAFSHLRTFYFQTVTFHGFRNETSEMIGNWRQKWQTITSLAKHASLVLPLAVAWWSLRRGRLWREEHEDQLLALSYAATLSVLQFLPTPTLTQYWVNVVPLLAFAAAPGVAALLERPGAQAARLRAAALAGYVAFAPYETFYLEIKPMAGGWCPYTMAEWNELSATIAQLTRPDDRVLAWWPGIVTSAHRRMVPGFENNFPYMASKRLPEPVRREFHIVGDDETIAMIERREPALVILRRKFFLPDGKLYEPIVDAHYRLAAERGDFLLYTRR